MQIYLKYFQSLTMITQLELGITDGVSVSLVSINVWSLAGDTSNFTCNFLYCNHQVHRDFMFTLYIDTSKKARHKTLLTAESNLRNHSVFSVPILILFIDLQLVSFLHIFRIHFGVYV
jgi:hypothetical protein